MDVTRTTRITKTTQAKDVESSKRRTNGSKGLSEREKLSEDSLNTMKKLEIAGHALLDVKLSLVRPILLIFDIV